ncbi:MAG: 4-alpha-glucanotransferase [Clostridia bacterium]|nr:4-alpha-glucanotransferase [Clostridia bacterium]
MSRKSGILMHISSLPSSYGIGTMGKEAYNFIDFLAEAGQKMWQVLPIGHTSYGDSPYQSYSSYAGNPYFIDLDTLCEEGLLERKDLEAIPREKDTEKVDYGMLFETRFPLLKKAAEKLLTMPPANFYTFLDENRHWIDDYAIFMAIKEKMGFKGREEWKKDLRIKGDEALLFADEEAVRIYKAIQFLFFKQWFALKGYANEKGIEITGDLPIYCASDSCDVWSEAKVFMLDEDYRPYLVAGCPPDGFSPLGQRWGNPIYDWDYLEKTKFSWWVERLRHSLKIFDVVRIDHFRGFDSYFVIDASEETAVNGKWVDGPKMKLFKAFEREIGENLPIIAEDLGYLTDSVKKLLLETGYPGMKVLQFAFDERESGDYLPHNYTKNSVCYVGTHDNDTAIGWYENVDMRDREKAKAYFNLNKEEGFAKGLIRGALASVSDTAIICMQDYLNLGSNARMNTPSTNSGNWQWRMNKDALTDVLCREIKEMTLLYGR